MERAYFRSLLMYDLSLSRLVPASNELSSQTQRLSGQATSGSHECKVGEEDAASV